MEIITAIEITLSAILIVVLIRFATQLHRLGENAVRLEATVDRMEAATEVVAHNLSDSVSRADATEGPEGAAADAALRTGDSAEAIHHRQDDAEEADRYTNEQTDKAVAAARLRRGE